MSDDALTRTEEEHAPLWLLGAGGVRTVVACSAGCGGDSPCDIVKLWPSARWRRWPVTDPPPLGEVLAGWEAQSRTFHVAMRPTGDEMARRLVALDGYLDAHVKYGMPLRSSDLDRLLNGQGPRGCAP